MVMTIEDIVKMNVGGRITLPKEIRDKLELDKSSKFRVLLAGRRIILDPFPLPPTFKEPCRFGGFCTDKELYEDCINDSRIKSNWMCWRDGILLKDEEPL